RSFLFAALPLALIVFILIIALPVVLKHNRSTSSAASGKPSGAKPSGKPAAPTTGGNGSVITAEDGTTFTYINNFCGFCELPSLIAATCFAKRTVPENLARNIVVHVLSLGPALELTSTVFRGF